MSIFHCLVIDSTTSKKVTTENPNLYPFSLCTSLRIIPKPIYNTEYYNRFVDPFNCKFECTVAEQSKDKNF